jgi:hypothetical protein
MSKRKAMYGISRIDDEMAESAKPCSRQKPIGTRSLTNTHLRLANNFATLLDAITHLAFRAFIATPSVTSLKMAVLKKSGIGRLTGLPKSRGILVKRHFRFSVMARNKQKHLPWPLGKPEFNN